MNLHVAGWADPLSLGSRRKVVGNRPVRDLAIVSAVRPLHALAAQPSLLFIATLAVMLFRPPDVQFYSLDRIAFFALIFVVLIRTLALKQSVRIAGPITLPMFGLLLLAFYRLLLEPYAAENWSLFAAKWLVPFVLYHLAGLVFIDHVSIRRFEIFTMVVLAYLSLTAIFFLLDARSLIYPRYILDESIGLHADRARGPFLQAVANGVHPKPAGLNCARSISAKTIARSIGNTFHGRFAFGDSCHKNESCVGVFRRVNNRNAAVLFECESKTRLLLHSCCLRTWSR